MKIRNGKGGGGGSFDKRALKLDGTYDASVRAGEMAKSSNGNDMLRLKLDVVDEHNESIPVTTQLVYQDNCMFSWEQFIDSAGLDIEDTDEITVDLVSGVKCQVEVTPSSFMSKEGKEIPSTSVKFVGSPDARLDSDSGGGGAKDPFA